MKFGPLAITGSALFALVLLVACGGREPTPTPTSTPIPTATPEPTATATPTPTPTLASPSSPLDGLSDTEAEYLAAVTSIDGAMGQVIESISEALSTTWPTRERLLDVLGEAEVSVVFDSAQRQFEQLDPPQVFRSDHERFLEFMGGTSPYLREHDQAVQDGDLVGIFIARAHAIVARQIVALDVSPAFCVALFGQEEDAPPPPFCDQNKSLPGGEYGVAIHGALERYGGEFNPRVGSFPPILTPEELYSALAALNPEIEVVIQETKDEVMGHRPPIEFKGDHDRLIKYLDENLETARAITSAANGQDEAKLRDELFPQSGDVFCAAQRDFSDEFRALIAPYFGDEVPPQCR